MSSNKKSFLLHIDTLDVLDDLDDCDVALLFRAIKSYQNGEEVNLSGMAKVAFSPFRGQFARDDEKYEITCKNRALAGSKGGKQKVANASKSKQEVANLADSVNKNKSDSKKDNDSKNINTLPAIAAPPSAPIDFSVLMMSEYELSEAHRIRKVNCKKKKMKGDGIDTQRIANGLGKEFNAARSMGYTTDELLTEWEFRGWVSLKSDWLKPKPGKAPEESIEWANHMDDIL